MPNRKVLIIGLGDLGARIASGLSRAGTATDVVVASRNATRGSAFARLASACGRVPVRFVSVDALDLDSLNTLIGEERPDLIVQCASLLSPWALFERADPMATPLREAGFALQLPAQLPAVHKVMQSVAATGVRCPVINCSYPDVTNAVLAALGLAPTIGIGNAGMVRALAAADVDDTAPLRLFAHHAHVGAVVCADRARLGDMPLPLLYHGDTALSADMLFAGAPIPQDKELNALSAAHALDIIEALLPGGTPLRTSAPGPLGLAGGWPVRIEPGHVTLDLPTGTSASDFVAFQQQSARRDGVERIDADGTVHFTDSLRERLPSRWRRLGDPLPPSEAHARHLLLLAALQERA